MNSERQAYERRLAELNNSCKNCPKPKSLGYGWCEDHCSVGKEVRKLELDNSDVAPAYWGFRKNGE